MIGKPFGQRFMYPMTYSEWCKHFKADDQKAYKDYVKNYNRS